VGLVYDPRWLPGVTIIRLGVAGVLQFYCENHEPDLPEYDTTWVKESADSKMAVVSTLAN
jgi:hypothetical protein